MFAQCVLYYHKCMPSLSFSLLYSHSPQQPSILPSLLESWILLPYAELPGTTETKKQKSYYMLPSNTPTLFRKVKASKFYLILNCQKAKNSKDFFLVKFSFCTKPENIPRSGRISQQRNKIVKFINMPSLPPKNKEKSTRQGSIQLVTCPSQKQLQGSRFFRNKVPTNKQTKLWLLPPL